MAPRLAAGTLVLVGLVGLARAQSPRETASITLNGSTMSIEYGSPALDGRDVLAMAKPGFVWRLGADRATSLKLTGPAVFRNMVIPAGEYSLFARRTSEREWFLIVNEQTGQWGTEHDPGRDLLGIPLRWAKQDQRTERLTIELTPEPDSRDTGTLSIRWGADVLEQRFRIPPRAP